MAQVPKATAGLVVNKDALAEDEVNKMSRTAVSKPSATESSLKPLCE